MANCYGDLKRWDLRETRKRLRNERTDPARTEQPSQDGDEMDEKNGKIAHQRIVAGRRILRNLGRNNNSPATWLGTTLNVLPTFAIPDQQSAHKSHGVFCVSVSAMTSNVVAYARSASILIDSAFPLCTNVADSTAKTGRFTSFPGPTTL
jgi:hypothetical protein